MQRMLARFCIFSIFWFSHKYNTLASGQTAVSCIGCRILPLTDSKVQIIYGSLFVGAWDLQQNTSQLVDIHPVGGLFPGNMLKT